MNFYRDPSDFCDLSFDSYLLFVIDEAVINFRLIFFPDQFWLVLRIQIHYLDAVHFNLYIYNILVCNLGQYFNLL